jgi:hypothetical protein
MKIRRSLALVACVALAACQPVDPGAEAGLAGVEEAAPLGAPEQGVPSSLGGLLDAGGRAAAEWQDRAVPVEITVEVADGRWQTAGVIYLAPESDRFLRYVVGPEGSEQSRPTLATLSSQPVTAPGLGEVPAPPDGMLDPAPLLAAASDALAGCGVDPGTARITYATGAPFAWDGRRWTQPPAWSATISDARRFAVVDPVSGAAGGTCGAVSG